MEDLIGEVVIMRGSDGWAYEGRFEGLVPRGLVNHYKLEAGTARMINWDDETTDPPTVEAVPIEGPVYAPEHLVTWIHMSHLGGKMTRKK